MTKTYNSTNEEFRTLTAGMSIPGILHIFNSTPQLAYRLGELQVSKGAVKAWLADPSQDYFRKMPGYKLEVFKAKYNVMRQRGQQHY